MTGQGELDYGLGETIGLLRESVRGFVKDEIAPPAKAVEREDVFSPELWHEMGGLGLLGITVPAEYGGAGMGYLEHVVVMEELSRASAEMGLAYSAHSSFCVNQLRLNGTEEQKRRYLPGLISGELIGAMALAGAEADSDVVSMHLSAQKQDSFYHLNGSTRSLTGWPYADVLIVYARTSPQKIPLGITAFIVEKNTLGFHVGDKLDMRSVSGTMASELIFDNCPLSGQSILGEVDQDVRVLLHGLDCQQLVLAGGPLGVMAACLDLLLSAMQHYKQPGHAARELQLMQGTIADMYTTWCACRSYVYTVARAADWGSTMRLDGAGVILYAAERATKMALDVIHLLGDSCQAYDLPAGRLLRDAKLFERGAATCESRRLKVARELFPETGR
ncbi:MAG: acyl-CoA dehydrogenase family protein [Proteobacteria bacterium]|nr:acyl-CoA dehydrogenase family protein [Pseudomonadota bacterium]